MFRAYGSVPVPGSEPSAMLPWQNGPMGASPPNEFRAIQQPPIGPNGQNSGNIFGNNNNNNNVFKGDQFKGNFLLCLLLRLN